MICPVYCTSPGSLTVEWMALSSAPPPGPLTGEWAAVWISIHNFTCHYHLLYVFIRHGVFMCWCLNQISYWRMEGLQGHEASFIHT